MERIKNNAFVAKIGFNRVVLFCALVLMYIVFAMLSPTFLKYNRILSALNYAYFLGFLSLGVTFVIATGGIDFSIGPVMFCAALIGGDLLTKSGVPLWVALMVSILVGTAFGALNGYFVAYWKMPPFITSMSSMMLAKGIGSVFVKTQAVRWPQATQENGQFRMLLKITTEDGTQIPTGIIFLLIIAVICAVILNKTEIGRQILCIGGNKEAVRLSGVNVKRWEMLAYIICGTLAGVAAVAYVGVYSTVQPGMGDTFNNEAIAGCVMGGTSMTGGVASISGTLIGVMIIALLQEGILAMGFQKDWQYAITGLIVIIAVYADVRSRRKSD